MSRRSPAHSRIEIFDGVYLPLDAGRPETSPVIIVTINPVGPIWWRRFASSRWRCGLVRAL